MRPAEVGDDGTVTLLFARNDRPEGFDRSALPIHRAQNCHDVSGCRISGEPAVFVRIPIRASATNRRLTRLLFRSVGCD
jgi:hypothetical protein